MQLNAMLELPFDFPANIASRDTTSIMADLFARQSCFFMHYVTLKNSLKVARSATQPTIDAHVDSGHTASPNLHAFGIYILMLNTFNIQLPRPSESDVIQSRRLLYINLRCFTTMTTIGGEEQLKIYHFMQKSQVMYVIQIYTTCRISNLNLRTLLTKNSII